MTLGFLKAAGVSGGLRWDVRETQLRTKQKKKKKREAFNPLLTQSTPR